VKIAWWILTISKIRKIRLFNPCGLDCVYVRAGYGHIAPKTWLGQLVTIVYAIFGIPLSLLTITNLGGFMATAFRFLYRNVCCALCCICCRRPSRLPSQAAVELETGTGSGNKAPAKPQVGTAVRDVTSWATLRQLLTNTDDIRSVQVGRTRIAVILMFYRSAEFFSCLWTWP